MDTTAVPGQQADWRALGTGVRLVVMDGDLVAARAAVVRVLDEVDRAYTRFRPDSELVVVNASAGTETRLSFLLARAIRGSLLAAARTAGSVDPTIGRAIRLLGYNADFSLVAVGSTRRIELRAEPVPGWTTVRLDERRRTVRMPRGVELDLGSTGKGLAADLAAAAALDAAGAVPERAGILVGLGGDIATAGRAPEGDWRILVAEDSETPSDAPGEVVSIEHGAMATSTTTVRRWTAADGVTLHHIVDRRTGLPAETRWRTATVATQKRTQPSATSGPWPRPPGARATGTPPPADPEVHWRRGDRNAAGRRRLRARAPR